MSIRKIIYVLFFLVIFSFLFNFNLSNTAAISIEELQARIAQIQAQIAALQKQLTQIQNIPTVETPEKAPGWCYNFYRSLAYGDKGSDIEALQTVLQKEGIYKGSITARFDSLTLSAVMSFQVKYAADILKPWGLIKGTGYVGNTTRAKLNELSGCKETVEKFITVVSPNGGEKWEQGNAKTITWNSNGIERVKISLVDYSAEEPKYIPISCIEGGTDIYAPVGRCNWLIWLIPLGNKYKISITESLSGSTVSDVSDDYFSIISPVEKSITVVSPNGGEAWRMGNTYRIQWEMRGLTSEHDVYIFVEAYDINKNRIQEKGQPQNIASLIPAARGYYDWKIPLKFDEWFENPPTYYKLFIRVVLGLQELPILGSSNDYFSILFPVGEEKEIPFITVISPNGGENWAMGNTYNIIWTSTKTINKIIISLEKPNWWVRDIAVGIPNTGNYSWTIPSDLEPGDYIIVVRELRTGVYGVYDRSNNSFTIVK